MRRLIAVTIAVFPLACQAVTGTFSVGASTSDGGADSAASTSDAGSDHFVESASDAPADVAEAGAFDAPAGLDVLSDVPVDAAAEAGTVCLTDLSNVGTGDFHIAFTLTTTAGSIDMALLNQRTGCDESSTWWDVNYIPSTSTTGGMEVATDDGTHYVVVEQATGALLDDGKPHRIVVARAGGQLGFTVDGTQAGGPLADPYAFGAMPPLKIGTDDCPGFEGTIGTITDVCLTEP